MGKLGYWIVNHKTKTYIEIGPDTERFDGEWKDHYLNVKGADWLDVQAFPIWSHDMVNDIPFVCDLCRDGGMFLLLVDVDKVTPEQIEAAKKQLRHDRDVVSLSVLRLRRAEA